MTVTAGTDPNQGQYYVDYDGSDGAVVELDLGNGITNPLESNTTEYNYTSGSALKFLLTTPSDVSEAPYRVDITDVEDSNNYELLASTDSEEGCMILELYGTGPYDFSYTPTSTHKLQIRVWWTQEQYEFDNCVGDNMIEFQIKGYGSVGYTTDSAFVEHYAQYENKTRIVLKSSQSAFELDAEPTLRGSELEGIWIEQASPQNIDLTGSSIYSSASGILTLDFSGTNYDNDQHNGKFVNIVFNFSSIDYAGALCYLDSWNFAYYGTSTGAIEECMEKELWAEGFGKLYRWNDDQSKYELVHTGDYYGMFGDENSVSTSKSAILLSDPNDTFKNAVIVTGDPTSGAAFAADSGNLLNLPYYEYCITLKDKPGTANDITFGGIVYILDSEKKFVVKEDNNNCTILDTTSLSDENVDLFVESSTDNNDFTVFGNGVCIAGNLEVGSGDATAAHITQEHSGINTGIGCRLTVFSNYYSGVKIKGGTSAAPWVFAGIPAFATSSDPVVAEIYYGNDGSSGKTVTISQLKDSVGLAVGTTITAIAVDTSQMTASVASITDNGNGSFEIAFNSNYDSVPLIITYEGGSTGSLLINRVGLDIKDNTVRSEGYYDIWHGTDKCTTYSSVANKVVTASFYYNTGSTVPTTTPVSLFVTIVTNSGTSHKIVTRLNSSFVETTGNDKWADDFLLWSGTDAEYDELISVSAIVYDAGDDDSFGGIRLGSGTGVEWRK